MERSLFLSTAGDSPLLWVVDGRYLARLGYGLVRVKMDRYEKKTHLLLPEHFFVPGSRHSPARIPLGGKLWISRWHPCVGFVFYRSLDFVWDPSVYAILSTQIIFFVETPRFCLYSIAS